MKYSRIFISPHPDDIAYSCFGSIFNTKCTLSTDVLITIFTRSIFPKYEYVSSINQEKEFSDKRVNEDKKFCQIMNCNYLHFHYPDSSVRKENDDISELRTKIYNKLKEILENNSEANIYIPLACKNHVDHKMVRDIVVEIFNNRLFSMERLFFYEDLPYANSLSKYKLKKHLENINIDKCVYKFESIIIDVETCWKEKMDAFHIYSTQKFQDHIKSITQHADMIGRGRKVERLWKIANRLSSDYQNFAWVSWEASRTIGGIGTVMSNIFKTSKYKRSAYRTILIGPMHMPLNVESKIERITEIATRLNSKILYAYGESAKELNKEVEREFKLIEDTYGVGIAYLRDYPQVDNSQIIERILIDLSYTVTKKSIYSVSLKYFLRDLEDKLGLTIIYDSTTEKELFNDTQKHIYDDELKRMITNLRDNVSSTYNHIDNDSIYGLLIAKPAIDALNAILSSKEICIMNVMDYFSLPTAYAAILERKKGMVVPPIYKHVDEYKKYKIRTHYLASEIKPIRSIAEGYIKLYNLPTPWLPEKESEVLIRCLVKNCIDREERLCLTDFPDLQHMKTHPPVKLLQKVHLLDCISAISEQVKEELMAINCNISSIGIAPHGNRYVELESYNDKIFYKGRILDKLNRLDKGSIKWKKFSQHLEISDVILSIHISRPEYCKKLERDIQLLHLLKNAKELQGKKIIHLFIGSFYQEYCRTYSRYLETKVTKINNEVENVFCMIINDPKWPSYQDENGKNYLTRDDLFRAADLNFGLSSYDSYGLSPLESLSCGTLSIISAASGSSSHIKTLTGYDKNVVVIDYHSFFCENYHYPKMNLKEIEKKMREIDKHYPQQDGRTFVECTVDYNNHLAAGLIAKKMPKNENEVIDLIKSGQSLSKDMSWENVVNQFLFQEEKPFSKLFER